MIPTYGSLFAGVGGFDLGLDAAGYDCRFQVEWDKHCRQVLLRHWPTVPKWDDVRYVNGAELPPVDLLTFGSPCQDLSVAGKRAGLAGERSGLFHQAMRIVKEMRNATGNQYPRIVVWENVVGALTSNAGSDFGTVISEMAESGALVVEWAVLDAQHFGVAQRRRRVFVVAIYDPSSVNRCSDPLLPVGESVRRNPAASRTARETTAETVTECFGNGSYGGWKPANQAVTLMARDHKTATTVAVVALAFDTQFGSNANVFADQSPTIKATQQSPSIMETSTVRRLTPIECERLMGWPDDHTLLRADGNEQSDAQRYRQIGNGVASPVAQWIGKHLCPLLA
jgi:DNA (cytosine-5)-methyltransferase 1